MGVDVTKANNQAAQLQDYATQLKGAKNNLQLYKNELSVNWTGTETAYVYAAIDKAIQQINTAITELENLQADVKTVASTIRQEEIAAQKAAEEAARKAAEEAARKAAEAEAARKAAEEAERQKVAQVAATKQTTSSSNNKNSSSSKNSSSNSSKKSSSSSSSSKKSSSSSGNNLWDAFTSLFK